MCLLAIWTCHHAFRPWARKSADLQNKKGRRTSWSQVSLSSKCLTRVLCLASSPSMKISAQRKAGRGKWVRQRFASHFSPSQSSLRFVTSHSRATRVSSLPLCEKRSAWGSEETAPGAMCWIMTLSTCTSPGESYIDLLPRNSRERRWVHFRKKLL